MNTRRVLVYVALFALAIVLLIGVSSPRSESENTGIGLVDLIETGDPEVIEEKTSASVAKNIESYVQDAILETPATVSFSLVDLKNSETVRINNTEDYVTASLYKLFVAYYTYDQIDKGLVSYSTPLGDGETVATCLEKIIIVSDNDCGVALGDYFGWTNITRFLQANGFQNTTIVRSEDPGSEFTSKPNDVESLLVKLYKHELLSKASTDAFIDLLLRQEINDRLPAVLPSEISVAHKTGDLYNYIHDVGIIFSPDNDYVFVIMTKDWDSSMTFGAGYEFFKVIYDSIFNNILFDQTLLYN